MCLKPIYFAPGSARPWAPSRCLVGCGVVLAAFFLGPEPWARAQVTISNGPSTNHFSGEGLSPSFFIPPSTLPVPTLEQGIPSVVGSLPSIPSPEAVPGERIPPVVMTPPSIPLPTVALPLADEPILTHGSAQPMQSVEPVSYTHLTLPTNREV